MNNKKEPNLIPKHCEWCGKKFIKSFEGKNVKYIDKNYFVCPTCYDLLNELKNRKVEKYLPDCVIKPVLWCINNLP